jgi:hypothetical protein
MINRSISKLVVALAAGAFLTVAQAAKPTLKEVTDATEQAAAAAPDKAADIVGAKTKATPEFACPIIKAAIKGAKLAKEDVAALVAAALTAAPEKAPEIKACLPADYTTGTGTDADGDITETDETGDLNGYRGVVGTYLAAPGGGGGVSNAPEEVTIVQVVEDDDGGSGGGTIFVPVTPSNFN